MVRRIGKKTLIISLAILVVLLIIIGIAVFINSQSSNPTSDTSKTTNQSEKQEPEIPEEAGTSSGPLVPEDTTSEVAIDPEQVSTTAIEPMGITVSYIKGIEGFEFQVLMNPNGTQYVQFSSSTLAGTRCTDDIGVFASIIEAPTENENATLVKTTTVDSTTYGLSLSDASCTNDEALLKQYQEAFSAPFTLLKKM